MVEQVEKKQGKTPENNGAQAILGQKTKLSEEERKKLFEKNKELFPVYHELKKDLQILFPKLFSNSNREIKPLERNILINIKKYFKEHNMPDKYKVWNKNGFSFLHWFTSNPFYLATVIKEKYRYDLTGKPIEKVQLKHKDYAVKKLLNIINNKNLALKEEAEKNKEKPKPDKKLKYLFLICKLYVEQRRDIALGKDFAMPEPKVKKTFFKPKQNRFNQKNNEVKPQIKENNFIQKTPADPEKIEKTTNSSAKHIFKGPRLTLKKHTNTTKN